MFLGFYYIYVYLFFEIFYCIINMLRCCDFHFSASKTFDIHAKKCVLLACCPQYFSKFLLNDVHNSGVDVIIYPGKKIFIHKPSDCSFNTICHIVCHIFLQGLSFKPTPFRVAVFNSYQHKSLTTITYMDFKTCTYSPFFSYSIIIFGLCSVLT